MPHQQPETALTQAVLREIGPRLRAARRKQGLTFDALAEKTGVSPSTLSRLESGKRMTFLPTNETIRTRLPHAVTPVGTKPVELIAIFNRRGERIHLTDISEASGIDRSI